MALEKRISDLIEPGLADMGFSLVRVQLQGTKHHTLQIMVDQLDERPVTVDDCANVSRAVSAILDIADPIADAYNLEVSSPGIDRPLTRMRDFERFAGFEAKIELRRLVDGRRRFRGILAGVDGDRIRIETETGVYQMPFDEIDSAKLVLTDTLIEASRTAADLSEGTTEGLAV